MSFYISLNNSDKNNTFHKSIKNIKEHHIVQQMKKYPHHGNFNCYEHCLHVAYYNYKWCRLLRLDYLSAARAGMLHDLFLYDWHTHAQKTGERFHGLTHPRTALKNAIRYFKLNNTEKDIILTHMWPVTLLTFPRTKEGWITVLSDKYCGLLEFFKII